MRDGTSAIDRGEFRDVVGHFATGVTVITSSGETGPAGMTANSFTSLSLDPLLVIVCIDLTSRTLKAVEHSGRVGVNILSADQTAIANVFASKTPESEKFEGIGWNERGGAPILDGTVAWLSGSVSELLPGGDHLIGVVAVDQMEVAGGEPLLFYRGGYASIDRT